MINVNIISGFLGAGKTTFLRKIIHVMKGQTVLIENEFSDESLDGELIEGNIPTKEIYSGCICCSLMGDFTKAIEDLILEYKPKNIMVEPSGVANIKDVIKSFDRVSRKSHINIRLNYLINIVDLSVFNDYIENFGMFYRDQIKNSQIVFLSHFDKVDDKEIENVIRKIKEINNSLIIIKEDWNFLSGEKIIDLIDDIKEYEINLDEIYKVNSTNVEFSSHSISPPRSFHKNELNEIDEFLKNTKLGNIIRAKGILNIDSNDYIYFDYTPYHYKTEYLKGERSPKVVIVGNDLDEDKLNTYFSGLSRCYDE